MPYQSVFSRYELKYLAEVLSRQSIFKRPYSKYGTAYQKMIYPYLQGGQRYA